MQDARTNFEQADDNARQVIRRTKQVTRRRFSPEEKVRIVIEGIRGELPVTALCRREGIASNVYYKWPKDFMEAGKCLPFTSAPLAVLPLNLDSPTVRVSHFLSALDPDH